MPGKKIVRGRRTIRTQRGQPLLIVPKQARSDLIKRMGIPDGNRGIQLKLKHVTFIPSNGSGVINSTVAASLVTAASNYTALSSLYDAFAVKAIKVKYIPLNVGAEGLSGSTNPYVRGTTIDFVDVDGTSIPTTVAGAIEYGNAKCQDPRKPFTRYWKIAKRYRSQMNDFASGWNTQNKDTTLCVNSDSNLPVSTNMMIRYSTFYVTCYGLR